MRRLVLLLWMFAALCAAGTARRARADEPSLEAAVGEACDAFHRAAGTEGVTARAAAFRVAAERFEGVIARGHQNGALEYDTGNAWVLAGDLGRAVLHYRRALLLRPGDPETLSNLATARGRRRDQIDATSGRAVLETVFFWHRGLARATKRVAAAVLWLSGFGLLGLALFLAGSGPRVRRLRIAGGACLLIAAALYVSVVVETVETDARDDAVLVAEEMPLRTGDGFGYPVRYENPIHSGAELRVLEDRGGWVRVELADGKSGWVPVDSIERV